MQDLNDKITGDTLTAAEWNEVPTELQNIIEALGLTLSSGDLNQLGKAIAGYVANGNFYTDSGSADAYVLSVIGSKQRIPSYRNGQKFAFYASADCTGGAVTVNVGSLGVKSVTTTDGSNPPAAAIQTDKLTKLVYNLSDDRMELDRTGQVLTTVVTATDATWEPQPDTKTIKFTAVGGGGGGGAIDGQGAGTAAGAGSGAGGGSAVKMTNVIDTSYNIVIGAGGTGGPAGNNSGSSGGDTTVQDNGPGTNVNLVANGGTGGTGDLGVSGTGTASGGNGGTATGGDYNIAGEDGGQARVVNGTSTSAAASGGSLLGMGVKAINPGRDGTGYGAGGSGPASQGDASNIAGGDGSDGVVIVEEYL